MTRILQSEQWPKWGAAVAIALITVVGVGAIKFLDWALKGSLVASSITSGIGALMIMNNAYILAYRFGRPPPRFGVIRYRSWFVVSLIAALASAALDFYTKSKWGC